MRAEARAHRWAALLGAVLLSSGCVTLTPRQGGSTSEAPHALSTLWEAGASTPPLDAPAPLASMEVGKHSLSAEAGEQERLHRRRSARGPGPDATLASAGDMRADEVASAGPRPQGSPSCGGQAVPPGWPDFSFNESEALLAPFLTCTSPAEYVALQEQVDMPRLVESLTDWDAVRLGPLGPVREDAAGILNRKRLSFILHASDTYGVVHAEVFVRFLLDSAHDDELREILFWLARDKRLETTLGRMPRARAELEARSLKLSARPDRDFQPGDLPRGVGRAVTDLLTHEQEKNAWYTHYARQRGQLPPTYQQDLDEVEREAAKQHYSAGSVVLGSVDHLTFGVPLGFYYLAAGTGHGLYSLSQGEYEQAVRELTPLALLTTLYVGGKGVRTLSEARRGGTGLNKPRIETQVGVRKPDSGLRYADVLVIEEGTLGGGPRRVETFSFKSRDLSGLGRDALTAQIIEDASEALRHYGERLDIRRNSLQSLLPGGSEVQVPRVRLIYEGHELKPKNAAFLNDAVTRAQSDVPGVEVSFQ